MFKNISAWSFSRLINYEECPYRAKLLYVDKAPTPPPYVPPGSAEASMDRGSRVHDEAEHFVDGRLPELSPELKKFELEFKKLKKLYDAGVVILEQDWAFTRDAMPTTWNSINAWCRLKLDALVTIEDHAIVIDYKTGKRYGNEVKHAEQGILYQLYTFLKYPDLNTITVEFWYLDQDEIYTARYNRELGLRYLDKFTKRGIKMTADTNLLPKPNKYVCKWCPYGANKGNGLCKFAIV